jgi:hypothetical protein
MEQTAEEETDNNVDPDDADDMSGSEEPDTDIEFSKIAQTAEHKENSQSSSEDARKSKKQKLISGELTLTPDDWGHVRTSISSQCVRLGDHFIWKGKGKGPANSVFSLRSFFSVQQPVHIWWSMAKNNGSTPSAKGHWASLCSVVGCLEHCAWIRHGVRSVLDMGDDDVTVTLERMMRHSHTKFEQNEEEDEKEEDEKEEDEKEEDEKEEEEKEEDENQEHEKKQDDTVLTKPCRLWDGEKSASGYGRTVLGRRHYQAHKLVWELHNRVQVPNGQHVRHKCKNTRDCIEITHLTIGTPKQNAEDRFRDGTALQGEESPCATIDNETARAIARSRGTATLAERAMMFDTSENIVTSIDNQSAWKSAMGPEELQHLAAHPIKNVRKALTHEEVREIRRRLADGANRQELAKELQLNRVFSIE